ncbi:MAG: UbiX family flavin prenyltransferase [Candidatus Thermoplasmatota archaeon]|nr:UbiX family flavin prenyltransferase [Candidatus Thermoplasmatota archaeon]MCL5889210.1 UbiX family flavin prenyltransferase [Candidatus Thermoplasmatota archaeon]
MKIVLGITGASGSILARRFLETADAEVHLVISANSDKVIEYETGYNSSDFKKMAAYTYDDTDVAARISSGSFIFNAMVIMPCSMNTLAKIAAGISDSLITRAAAVALKERRRLILVPREMPLSAIALENMTRITRAGGIIAAAMPAFYTKPQTIGDMVDFMVGRVMDLCGMDNILVKRWKGEERD